MNKDYLFGIIATLFFLLLMVIIAVFGEPSEEPIMFAPNVDFLFPFMIIGVLGAGILVLLERRKKRPGDFRSMDQMYSEYKNTGKTQAINKTEDGNQPLYEKEDDFQK